MHPSSASGAINHGQNETGTADQLGVYIVGLGHHYPPYVNKAEDIEEYLAKFHDTETPA